MRVLKIMDKRTYENFSFKRLVRQIASCNWKREKKSRDGRLCDFIVGNCGFGSICP